MTTNLRPKQLALKPGEMHANNYGGLYSLAVRSHQEVAHIMGLTRQRVQQIERQALLKLRHKLAKERDGLL